MALFKNDILTTLGRATRCGLWLTTVLATLLTAACDDDDDKPQLFTLTTDEAVDISDHYATLQGSVAVQHQKDAFSVGFFLSERADFSADATRRIEAGSGTKGAFSAKAEVKPKATYYYRAYAQYRDSVYTYGNTMTFTTPVAQTSVLVYIAGDNNLSSYIGSDLSQMCKGSKELAEGSNLILFIDQTGRRPYFARVEQGDTVHLESLAEEAKSSDAETLRQSLQWLMENYPANSYGLVLWGHADGWIIKDGARTRSPRHAYGQDVTGGEQWMNIPDMAKAIASLKPTAALTAQGGSGKPLRFIFADCCCFQSVESAYELRDCADYIIGSAAEIPGEGAPYHTVLPALFSTADDFYVAVADAYTAQVSYDYREPMSVIKTAGMQQLAQATKEALAASLTPFDKEARNYPDVNGLIYYYDMTLFDMNDFMRRHADAATYAQWKSAFDDAVPYKTMTTVWMANHVRFQDVTTQMIFRDFEVTEERYGGVSMFVPQDPDSQTWVYRSNITSQNERISQMQWYEAAGLDLLGW